MKEPSKLNKMHLPLELLQWKLLCKPRQTWRQPRKPREVLMRQEGDIKQKNQLTMLTAVKAEQDVIAAIIALQAAKELGYQGTDDLSLDRPDP